MTPEQIQLLNDTAQKTKELEDLLIRHEHTEKDRTRPLLKPYGGYVNANGTAANLPHGWSSTKTGTGAYTITHNLGHTRYNFIAIGAGGAFHIGAEYAINTNSFDISFVTTAAALQDADFMFILLPYL